MKEIERRDKSINSIDIIENEKCLLISLRRSRLGFRSGVCAKTRLGEAMKFLPEFSVAGLDLISPASYVTDIRCVAAAAPDRTPNAGQAAALPDP
ncbi:hypothetical protein [Rhizobium ruizarguesonis]|uniref:hypothetical protein n=1 Tax=Rhizobium ruizarguesonis TaxID=2081791 RepID=UPI00195499A3|nr:hypothetical protein [Rhizobium ruizarguesonis]